MFNMTTSLTPLPALIGAAGGVGSEIHCLVAALVSRLLADGCGGSAFRFIRAVE